MAISPEKAKALAEECGVLNPCRECLWRMVHVAERVITAAKEVVDLAWFDEYRILRWSGAQELKDAVDAAVAYGNTTNRHRTPRK